MGIPYASFLSTKAQAMNIGDILLFTFNSIMPLILIIAVGYLLKRIGFFTKDFLKIANKTVFYVCLPVLLFKNIFDIEELSQIRFDVVLYVLVIVAIVFFIGFLFTLFIKDPKQKGVIHQCVFRSNFALIGVPLAELIGGNDGVRIAAILSMFTIPTFNVLSVIVLSVYKGQGVKLNGKKILLDIVKNPLIIGVLSGLLCALIKNLISGTVVYTGLSNMSFLYTAIS